MLKADSRKSHNFLFCFAYLRAQLRVVLGVETHLRHRGRMSSSGNPCKPQVISSCQDQRSFTPRSAKLPIDICRAKELVKPPEPHMTTSLLSAVAELFLLYIKTTTRPSSRWGSHREHNRPSTIKLLLLVPLVAASQYLTPHSH